MNRRPLVFLALTFLACTSEHANSNIQRFSGDDPQMRAAIDSARATIGIFLRRIARRPPASQTYASIKLRFGDSLLGEHIWLDSVRFDGHRLHGQVNEDAVQVEGVRQGQWASTRPDQISDWMIVDRGVLCGGFTIRVERSRLSNSERAAMDSGLAALGLRTWATRNSC